MEALPPGIGSRMTGAEWTTPSRTIASRLPTLSSVTRLKSLVPLLLNRIENIGIVELRAVNPHLRIVKQITGKERFSFSKQRAACDPFPWLGLDSSGRGLHCQQEPCRPRHPECSHCHLQL